MNKIEFGRFIRKQRLRQELTLRKFSQEIEISAAYISRMERGYENPPTEKKIIKMAEILKLDENELLAKAGKLSSELYNCLLENPQEWLRICRLWKKK